MSIVFDIAVVLIVAGTLILGYKKGFIRTVVNLIGYAIASAAAFFISSPLSGLIFKSAFRNSAVEMINGELVKLSGGQSVTEMLQAAFAAIPQNIAGLAPEGSLESLENSLMQGTPTTMDISTLLVDNLLGPIVEMILTCVLFLILFLIFSIVVKLITRQLGFINKIPLLGTANQVLGLVLGIVEAVLFLFVFTSIVGMVIQLSGGQWNVINQDTVNHSFIFKFLYEFNPLLQLK